jgi:hypothetical protein
LAEKLKFWSSKLVVREGYLIIDIFLAAKGMSSTVPKGAQQQTFPYPETVFLSDPFIFHGQNTEFYINEAEKQLFAMMKLPSTSDGCMLVIKQRDLKELCHRRWS